MENQSSRRTRATSENPPSTNKTIILCVIILSIVIILCGGGSGLAFFVTSILSEENKQNTDFGFSTENSFEALTTSKNNRPGEEQSTDKYSQVLALVVPTIRILTPSGNREFPLDGRGSGFLVSSDGLLLTNYHVVKGYLESVKNNGLVINQDGVDYKIEIYISLFINGEEFHGNVVDRVFDENLDYALIKIESTGDHKFPYLEFNPAVANSNPIIKRLDPVLALGFPGGVDNIELTGDDFTDYLNIETRSNSPKIRDQFTTTSFDYTATQGIVSKVTVPEAKGFQIINHDALISPGSSGGPLIDNQGYIVGINTLITFTEQGVVGGYHAHSMKDIYPRIAKYLK